MPIRVLASRTPRFAFFTALLTLAACAKQIDSEIAGAADDAELAGAGTAGASDSAAPSSSAGTTDSEGGTAGAPISGGQASASGTAGTESAAGASNSAGSSNAAAAGNTNSGGAANSAGATNAASAPNAGGASNSAGAGNTSSAGGAVNSAGAPAGGAPSTPTHVCDTPIDLNGYTPSKDGCGGYTTCKGQIHFKNNSNHALSMMELSFTELAGVTCTNDHAPSKWTLSDNGASSHRCVFTAIGASWNIAAMGTFSFGYDTSQSNTAAASSITIKDPTCE